MKNFVLVLLLLLAGHWWAAPDTAFALIAAHLNYDGCNTCHALHGSPSGFQLLAGVDTESTCLACHGPLSPVATEVAIHDPAGVGTGSQGYISCRECHDAHDNQGSNIKLVGYDWDPVVDPGEDNVFANPTIRVETTSTSLASPEYNTVIFTARPADFQRGDNAGPCQICHTAGPASGPTALQNHEWGDCVICHMHDDGFKKRQCVECHDVNATLVADAPKVVDKSGGSVGAVGSHLRVNGSDMIVGLSDLDWTVQCIECHTGHSGNVIIPNNPIVGIDYQLTGGIGLGGAATLPNAPSEAEICWDCHSALQSEWNGQAYNGFTVSTEDWTTAEFNAPGGLIPTRPTRSIHTANDIDAPETGDVENDVRSSSVADNVDGSGYLPSSPFVATPNNKDEVLEKVKYIRCSYCHDVHDTVAGSPTKGDVVVAENGQSFTQTYLRGTWLPNAYTGTEVNGTANAPEIPPWDQGAHSGNTAAENNGWYYSADGQTDGTNVTDSTTSLTIGSGTHNNWGHQDRGNSGNPYRNFPRLFATSPGSNRMGGFFIDQNSGWPTRKSDSTYLTVSETAGLCLLCHNQQTDNLDYYNSATLWQGINGHSNSTLGGTGGVAIDLFNARRDLTDTDEYGMHGQPIPDTQGNGREWGNNDQTFSVGTFTPQDRFPFGSGFNNLRTDVDGGSNYTPPFNTGWYDENGEGGKPRLNSASGDYTNWYTSGQIGVDGDDYGGANDRAHNFSCSKCHTPHASGLPALLITNCLDYQLSDWFTYGNSNQTDNIVVGPLANETSWAGRAIGNCHRKEDANTDWNTLAPAQ